MQQPQSNPGYSELQAALTPLIRQLDRLEERTRDLATRSDLDLLRKELVARDVLESKLAALTILITRNATDTADYKKELEGQISGIRQEQISRMERFWMRFGPLITLGALILTFLEFSTHFRITP